MYLITIVDDNLNETHYLADSVEDAERFLLEHQFDGDKKWMDSCYDKNYDVCEDFHVWREDDSGWVHIIEKVEKIELNR